MQNGYHTAKVEWIKDEPIPEEELGNLKTITFNKFCHLKLLETGFKLQSIYFGKESMLPNIFQARLKR